MHRGAIFLLKEPKINIFALGKASVASILQIVFISASCPFVSSIVLVPELNSGVVVSIQGHTIININHSGVKK
jgi:hypothetical protein